MDVSRCTLGFTSIGRTRMQDTKKKINKNYSKSSGSASKGEALLALHLNASKISFVREYKFCKDRKWRADFCFPERRLLVEVEGGIWKEGRHTRGSGFMKDCEKYNQATLEGWALLRVTYEHI